MKIEIKNVKYAAFASEATACFSATVYIDGVKAGTVDNDGRGGSDRFHPYAMEEKLEAYAKTLPPIVSKDLARDGEPFTFPESAEGIIGKLLDEYLAEKQLKATCSRKTCFRIPGQQYEEGEYNVRKIKYSPEVKAQLISKYGSDVFILNDKYAK